MKGLEANGFPHTIATQKFISHVHFFFDCLNVSTIFGGRKKLKDACQPCTNADDWQLKGINLNAPILIRFRQTQKFFVWVESNDFEWLL